MKEINIVFRTLWHERSNSVDEPYKQWVRMGFDWCHDLMCSKDEKTRIIDRLSSDFCKLASRYDEVHNMVDKRGSKISWLELELDQKEQSIKCLKDENEKLWSIIGYTKGIEKILREEKKEPQGR